MEEEEEKENDVIGEEEGEEGEEEGSRMTLWVESPSLLTLFDEKGKYGPFSLFSCLSSLF